MIPSTVGPIPTTTTPVRRNIFACVSPQGDQWKAISAEYVNPVTDPSSCGSPCADIRPQYNFLRDDDGYSY